MPSPLRLRSRLTRRVGFVGAAAFTAHVTVGCHAYQVADVSAVQPGAAVVVSISDRGRVDLNGALGTSPATAEGRLAGRTDSTVTLAVTQIASITGERTTWTGDTVTLRLSNVSGVQTKHLDRGRTTLAIVASVAAVVAVITGVSLAVSNRSGGDSPPPGPPPGGETSKSPSP